MPGKIKVSYNTEVVNRNKIVSSQGCNCISFLNAGRVDATILGHIPLEASAMRAHHFNNLVDEEIEQNFPVTFTTGNGKLVVVVRTFKKRV
jgi:hypothetical protein